jgi:hypothetical protein
MTAQIRHQNIEAHQSLGGGEQKLEYFITALI